MACVFLTTFDVKLFFLYSKKILKYIDKSDMSDKHKDYAHSILDPSHARYYFHDYNTTWKDMLLHFDDVIPKVTTESEKEYYRKCLENLVINKVKYDANSPSVNKDESIPIEIRPKEIDHEPRFVIVKRDTNEVLDDAQGYGYTSYESACKAAWYKFRGGKQQVNEAVRWWKHNRKLLLKTVNFVNRKDLNYYEDKKSSDYARVIKYITKKCELYKIDDFKEDFVKHLKRAWKG